MAFEALAIIREIYRQSNLQRIVPPAATRIVKLIYLADIEWRKRHNGEPLADLTWRFLHFGPYASELSDTLGSPDMKISEIGNGITARRFASMNQDIVHSEVSEEVAGILSVLVKTWGDADLNSLLDYVYFDTEPMENAKRGELLDFSHLRRISSQQPSPKVNKLKFEQIRSKIRERTRALALTQGGLHIPFVDVESFSAWDEDHIAVDLQVGTPVRFT